MAWQLCVSEIPVLRGHRHVIDGELKKKRKSGIISDTSARSTYHHDNLLVRHQHALDLHGASRLARHDENRKSAKEQMDKMEGLLCCIARCRGGVDGETRRCQ